MTPQNIQDCTVQVVNHGYKMYIWKCRQKLGLNRNGWSPDNSMCEGFFRTIKNEFFYPNNWKYYYMWWFYNWIRKIFNLA